MILAGNDLLNEPLTTRGELLRRRAGRIGRANPRVARVARKRAGLVGSVKAQGLEGLYEPGLRTGAWQKMRVIGGDTVASKNFDAVIFGYYDGSKLMYARRTRSGFTPSSRDRLFKRFIVLATAECPFSKRPEARGGRCGEGLTAEKMKECRWLKPKVGGPVRIR